MNVTRDGDSYRISRVTGPTHNLLVVRFGKRSSDQPVVEDLRATGEIDRGQ